MTRAEIRLKLVEAAGKAAGRAYAPYSGYRVGAAVLTARHNLYEGCNVENASYGLTICAERAAVAAAVASEGPEMKILALAVVSQPVLPFAPCGACRQVILEFGAEAWVIFQGQDGLREMRAKDLLPDGFKLPQKG